MTDDETRKLMQDAEDFINDPWRMPLADIAAKARDFGREAGLSHGRVPEYSEMQKADATYYFAVLQARAVLAAAKTNADLVHATWWVVGLTAVLAIAAVVALFIGG